MARTVRDANLETRAARGRLKARHEPYWRAIDRGRHLGYRKGARGGVWLARHYAEGKYRKTVLGTSDDVLDANGVGVLSYRQAQEKAHAWFAEQDRKAAGLDPDPGPYTVADAMRDYLAWYARHRKALYAVRSVVETHVLPELGGIELSRLTARTIRTWHEGLAEAPARLRTRPGQPLNTREAIGADAKRKRKSTANHALTALKAALNYAFREGKVASDEAWRRVRPFRNVDAAVVRYLTEPECVRLVNACAPDFRELVRAAVFTGCRYGELAAHKVSDFDPDAGTLAVRSSKAGKPRHVVLTDEAREFFASMTAGRLGDETMFLRADGKPWNRSHQRRPLLEACTRAKISPPASFHVLRHTHGSHLAMQGVPLGVIAVQLGHADLRMAQRYSHLSPSYVAETIRASFPTLGITKPSKVATLRPKGAR